MRGEVGSGPQVGARPPRREEGRGGKEGGQGRGKEGGKEGGLLFFKSSVPSHRLCLRIQEQLLYTKEPRARRGRTDGRTDGRTGHRRCCPPDKGGGAGGAGHGGAAAAPRCRGGGGGYPGLGATGLRWPGALRGQVRSLSLIHI